jgi:hypothetical protein
MYQWTSNISLCRDIAVEVQCGKENQGSPGRLLDIIDTFGSRGDKHNSLYRRNNDPKSCGQ